MVRGVGLASAALAGAGLGGGGITAAGTSPSLSLNSCEVWGNYDETKDKDKEKVIEDGKI